MRHKGHGAGEAERLLPLIPDAFGPKVMSEGATIRKAEEKPLLLSARGLVKSYGGNRAVDGVDLDIPERAFTTLLGPSGCGKTTILRMIGGFETPDAGSLTLDGRSLAGVPPERRPVNTVFQNYALFPHMTVFENVAFSLTLRRGAQDPTPQVKRALDAVHMGEFAARYPHQLSGGQQQRVAVARAIIAEPHLLLLDEPLSALDRKMRSHLQIELKDLQRRLGIAFVYVTHDQEEAFALSDMIVVMNRGKIAQKTDPLTLYARPADTFVADFIGSASLIEGEILATAKEQATIATPLGTITAPAVEGLAPGQRAALVLRPENLRQAPAHPGSGKGHEIAAQVRHVVFKGDRFMIEAEAAGLALRLMTEQPPEPGAEIRIAFDPKTSFITRLAS
ncbi:ABC transporter ATP-binding protein [Allorhizobium taibaishanense]|uniref:Spermidine/putrescine transport system ATP-binding protein n=2 Tax=Allorhizobium taibaishanense TaxID=887144 RepID=A0A7W6HNF0_9HYPH|nr:ABC transporter ATP-binding protein [Allorhizobium taibaishanense]MBB4008366.1 spermidine/putrescine transport system ATP-binding protein [Allorhizobium taibaishanense]